MTDVSVIERLQHIARAAAWQAGQIVKDNIHKPHTVKFKGPRDLVTETDTAAQLAAIAVITAQDQTGRILAEEDPRARPGKDGRWKIPDGLVWVIDPLDGTTNFASGLPVVAVSIGAALDGEPVAGAIFDPLRDELFEAGQGLGALVNGRPVNQLKRMPLEDAIICLDWAREAETRSRVLAAVSALAPHCRTVRALGSAALGLAYAAAGRAQLYFNFALQPWDACAGAVILREAGGDLFAPDGQKWQLDNAPLVAGQPDLAREAIQLMQS